MKHISTAFLLILILCTRTYAQGVNFDKEISELFFNLKINAPLKELVKSPSLELEYSKSAVPPIIEDETYRANFTKHPKIEEDIKAGRYDIIINKADKKEGCYQAFMAIEFDSEYAMIDEYERLIQLFEDYSAKTLVETVNNEDYELVSQTTTYQRFKKPEVPSITFSIGKTANGAYTLGIMFVNCTQLKNKK